LDLVHTGGTHVRIKCFVSFTHSIPFHSMGCLDVRGTRSVELASMDSCSSETISVFVRKSHCGALFLFEVINNLLALSPSLVWSGLVRSSSVIRETW
jgi:hypothetical protein